MTALITDFSSWVCVSSLGVMLHFRKPSFHCDRESPKHALCILFNTWEHEAFQNGVIFVTELSPQVFTVHYTLQYTYCINNGIEVQARSSQVFSSDFHIPWTILRIQCVNIKYMLIVCSLFGPVICRECEGIWWSETGIIYNAIWSQKLASCGCAYLLSFGNCNILGVRYSWPSKWHIWRSPDFCNDF